MSLMPVATPTIEFRTAYWQLEPIERKFVDGYVSELEKVAERSGTRLASALMTPLDGLDDRALAFLARPLIRSAIAERVKDISDLCDVSVYRTLKSVTAIAYSSMEHFLDIPDDLYGYPDVSLNNCTPEQLSVIKSFEWEDKPKGGRKVKIVLHDKLDALKTLMRYQGLLAESNEHWQEVQKKEKPSRDRLALPATADDEQAAELYSRAINGS
jgi:hypothetical protein